MKSLKYFLLQWIHLLMLLKLKEWNHLNNYFLQYHKSKNSAAIVNYLFESIIDNAKIKKMKSLK